MKSLLTILCLFVLFSTCAQQLQFTWGSPILQDPKLLSNMEVVGVDDDGFFAIYHTDKQINLEHFNPENFRLWTTALRPKTPDGSPSTFHSIQMIKGTLYMISSSSRDGETTVYAQEIKHNGNYGSSIIVLAKGKDGKKIYFEHAKNGAAFAVVIQGDLNEELTSTLLTHRLVPRWTTSLTPIGDLHDILVHTDGTTYLLARDLPASPATTAFYLHKLDTRNGKSSEVIIGDSTYRPIKAKLAATSRNGTIIAGYIIPSSYVVTHNPEPIGTFYYRFNNHNLNDQVVSYVLFSSDFIQNYKRLKPDYDQSQRLRYLRLDKIIPVDNEGVLLIGEVYYRKNQASFSAIHNNDVVIVHLRENGTQAYIQSANKIQISKNNELKLYSYFATPFRDSLKIIYLHYDYSSDSVSDVSDSSGLADKKPVLVNIYPDGTKNMFPYTAASITEDPEFYLCPTSAFKVSEKEFIVLGFGNGYYKYGRMYLK